MSYRKCQQLTIFGCYDISDRIMVKIDHFITMASLNTGSNGLGFRLIAYHNDLVMIEAHVGVKIYVPK